MEDLPRPTYAFDFPVEIHQSGVIMRDHEDIVLNRSNPRNGCAQMRQCDLPLLNSKMPRQHMRLRALLGSHPNHQLIRLT
jgi:hypothetical protein